MNLQVSTSEIRLTEDIYDLLEKKLSSKIRKHLKRYSSKEIDARLILSKDQRWGFKVKLTLSIPGQKTLFAENKHKELEYAITGLTNEVERRLRKLKEKRRT